jgi:hypothetical protein
MILNHDKEIDQEEYSGATAGITYLSSNIADPSSNNSSTEPNEADLPPSFPTELCDLLRKSDFNLF